MSDEKGYNGWKNYETWNCNLWIDNDQGTYSQFTERAEELLQEAIDDDEDEPKQAATTKLAEDLSQWVEESAAEWMPDQSSMFSDAINAYIREINFHEIAEHFLADIDVYSAGWNMPGYMPDNPPLYFLDAALALKHIQDAAKEALESEEGISEEDSEQAAETIDDWKADKQGEFGQTIGNYHYFVAKL